MRLLVHLKRAAMLHLAKVLLLFAVSAATTDFDDLVKTTLEPDLDAMVAESENQAIADSTETLTCSYDCPFGWVKFNGRCYIYRALATDWASAENDCIKLGANLVSIHNEDEQQLVKALIRSNDPKENPTWIGLSDCQKKYSWIWSDGTKLTYSKWNAGEPNFVNNECCVHINWSNQKDWTDVPCLQNYNFVCVKRINPYIYIA